MWWRCHTCIAFVFFFFFDLKGGHLEFMCKSINRAEEINNNHRFFFLWLEINKYKEISLRIHNIHSDTKFYVQFQYLKNGFKYLFCEMFLGMSFMHSCSKIMIRIFFLLMQNTAVLIFTMVKELSLYFFTHPTFTKPQVWLKNINWICLHFKCNSLFSVYAEKLGPKWFKIFTQTK